MFRVVVLCRVQFVVVVSCFHCFVCCLCVVWYVCVLSVVSCFLRVDCSMLFNVGCLVFVVCSLLRVV